MSIRKRRRIAEINVVPYIDVMLVLLVVFMVTAPLITQGLAIQLPEANGKPLPQQEEPVVVSLTQDGQYFVNISQNPRQPLSLGELQDRVQKIVQNRPNVQVLIEGDGAALYQGVIELMRVLQATGVKQIGLLTNPVTQSEST
ncbi:MAG: protein TolR [Gammaproteobacteria bacterium]|jgi:biopolymer transport protein TolR